MTTILKTKDLTFQDFLRYPDLEIIKNQCTFITGVSGSGKSTLLRLFNQSLSQSSGKIYYNNTDIETCDTITLRKQILLCGQSVFLFPNSIYDNFKQYFAYREETPPSDDHMKKYLSICQINAALEQDTSIMSGGERARIYMAIHLAMHPNIFMLDEPTAALDHENSECVMRNILKFCREQHITVIIVSHDMALTEKFCDKEIQIRKEDIRA